MRVLIVASNHHQRAALREALLQLGHAATACSAGDDGLQLLARRRFDAMLLDLDGRDMTNLQLMREVPRVGAPPVLWLDTRTPPPKDVGARTVVVDGGSLDGIRSALAALGRETHLSSTHRADADTRTDR